MNQVLAPSILSADFSILGEEIEAVKKGGAIYLHFDVMDGQFVPNISFGAPILKSIRPKTDLFLDVHLMVEEPIRFVEMFAEAGADLINVHVEACKDLEATIQKIKETGKKVGITIKPDTPVETIENFLSQIDMVLVMSVYPGFGGQSFIEESIERIGKIRKMADKIHPDLDIEVDGGIKLDNIIRVKEAGANIFVAGSAVFAGDVRANTKAFMEKLYE